MTLELGGIAILFLVVVFNAGIMHARITALEEETKRVRDRLDRLMDGSHKFHYKGEEGCD